MVVSNPLGRCPKTESQCRMIFNKSLIEESDAVLFNTFYLDNPVANMPKFRSPEQQWIFFILEPPTARRQLEQNIQNLPPHLWFNLTFTYRYR